MSKSAFNRRSDFDDTALDWTTSQWSLFPKKQKNALFDIFLTRFGKTSRRAARAVRDFVTCSSPQSNGFSAEDLTTNTSQESQAHIQDETPSSTSNLHIPQDKHVCDGPIRHQARHQDFKDEAQHPNQSHPNHGHRKKTHGHVSLLCSSFFWMLQYL